MLQNRLKLGKSQSNSQSLIVIWWFCNQHMNITIAEMFVIGVCEAELLLILH